MRAKVLKYPGSKWNIATQLVNLIPQHHSYVEPFFGSGALLFNKPLSEIETINNFDPVLAGTWIPHNRQSRMEK